MKDLSPKFAILRLAILRLAILRSISTKVFIIICCTALFLRCGGNEEDRPIIPAGAAAYTPPFELPQEFSGKRHDIRRVDVNGDGFNDALLSLYRDSSRVVRGFEMLLVYEYDSTRKTFINHYQDKYYYGTAVDVQQLFRDSSLYLVITTDGGGNNPVISRGMVIIQRKQGKWQEMITFDDGAPEIITTGQDSTSQTSVLVAKSSYRGESLPESDMIVYPDSIVVFHHNSTMVEQISRQIMEEEIVRSQGAYRQAKAYLSTRPNDPRVISELYAHAVIQMALLKKVARTKDRNLFYSKELPYWRSALPAEYREAIQDLYAGKASGE